MLQWQLFTPRDNNLSLSHTFTLQILQELHKLGGPSNADTKHTADPDHSWQQMRGSGHLHPCICCSFKQMLCCGAERRKLRVFLLSRQEWWQCPSCPRHISCPVQDTRQDTAWSKSLTKSEEGMAGISGSHSPGSNRVWCYNSLSSFGHLDNSKRKPTVPDGPPSAATMPLCIAVSKSLNAL